MIELRKPEGWDQYHETHQPLVFNDLAGGVLWIPNDVAVVHFPHTRKTFEDELMEAMSTPIEDD
ncbi:hypothetical protein SEA_CECE_62 [Microbacterium phage Cece]|nr:hypothetical protein SEA_CECE_62 [Microbacterium phage Cece]